MSDKLRGDGGSGSKSLKVRRYRCQNNALRVSTWLAGADYETGSNEHDPCKKL